MKSYSPIVLFTYNRPLHTQQTLDALALNKESAESVLYIYCEGAKNNASHEQLNAINEVRALVKKEQRFKEVHVVEQTKNLGLADSVLLGVTAVIQKHGQVIVLEDDHVTSRYFLKYMNDALEVYEKETSVACISAYIYPVKGTLPETFFVKGADCWGWGTWKRAWDSFEKDGKKLLNELEQKKLTHAFDFDGTYIYTEMLRGQIAGTNNSWAIRWYASAFLKSQYCLYPGTSLVQNIGIDGSGTHSGAESEKWTVHLAQKEVTVLPIKIEENSGAKQQMIDYFKSISTSPSLLNAIVGKLKLILKK